MQSLVIENKIGGGPLDYMRYYLEAESFFDHTNNQTAKYQIALQDLGETDFVVPTRGSYVTFIDDRWQSRDEGVDDGILFTGYVIDEPKPVYLGSKAGVMIFKYVLDVTSDDFLLQIKDMPSKTYVNKSRGFIIRDLVATMFDSADVSPLDVSGVKDGGIERLYQTERTKKFADVLADFAKSDGYRYRVLNGKLFYEPEAEFMPAASEPEVKLVVDEQDPRFSPYNLNLDRIATSIVNDVTVYGEDEPTTFISERYVSDGYMGEFQLLEKPFGVTEKVLIDDDFTAPTFDTAVWQEVDDELALTGLGDGSYLQLFEGALNLVGGPGVTTVLEPQIYLRAKKGIELSGIIDTRDGELYFPPSASGIGHLGGLYTDESMSIQKCFSSWGIDVGAQYIVAFMNGNIAGPLYPIEIDNDQVHYILRRRFEFDIPVGSPTIRRGPLETDLVFGDVPKVNGCWVTYFIDKIDATNPQNIITTKSTLYSARYENVPEFALYAAVVNYDMHAVINFVKVMRPQQVRVEVNGQPVKMGDFIDGGVGTIVVEDDKAKLAWYSLPTASEPPADPTPVAGTPVAFWKLGDAGDVCNDSQSGTYPSNSHPLVTLVAGSPSASIDQARHFPGPTTPYGQTQGVQGPIAGNPFFSGGFPSTFSLTGWVRTDQADGAIFSLFSFFRPTGNVGMLIKNGRLQVYLEYPETPLSGGTAINDGQWHHVAWTHDGTTSKLYVDGTLDATGPLTLSAPASAGVWYMGYDNTYYPSLDTFVELFLTGDLDEIALWPNALIDERIAGLFQSAQAPSSPPVPAYNPQTGVTIPPQGSIVTISYFRSEQSKCRVRSLESIASERARFGDDGVRQATILAGEAFPTPRTSEECQYLAQAYLADRAQPRYEGEYTFETGENDITKLVHFPAAGDLIPIDVTLANGERINTNLVCTGVSSSFIGAGAYAIRTVFGPRSRYEDAQRKLILARKSSLDNAEIKEDDILTAEVLNSTGYSVPPDPTDALVTQVTPLTFTVNMNPSRVLTPTGYGSGGGTEVDATLPDGVIGYEIRRDETGWGQPNYVARVSSAVFTLNRGTRDRAYFIRPYNDQSVYSRHSALVRVISPLSNTLVATGLDGDITAQDIRLFIPLTRNPDIGGFLVQKDNADGVVIYLGDGIMHRTIISGASVLVESSRITITWPNTTAATSATVRVLVYNLVNEFGPETIFTITRQATV